MEAARPTEPGSVSRYFTLAQGSFDNVLSPLGLVAVTL